MIKKTTLIKNVIGKKIDEYGFQYESGKNGRWTFTRKVNDVLQYIVICKSNFQEGIRIEFYTSVNDTNRIEATTFSEKYRDKYFFPYNDEDTFMKVLEEFNIIIDEYGLKCLDELSIRTKDTEIRVYEEMHKELFENHNKYYEKFKSKFNIQTENTIESIKGIQQILLESIDLEFDDKVNLVFEAAAFYGELILNTFKGQWNFNEAYKACSISLIKGKRELEIFPLSDIARYRNIMNVLENNLLVEFQEFADKLL